MSETVRIAIQDEEVLAEAWDRLRHLYGPELGSRPGRAGPWLSEAMADAVERTLDTVPGVSGIQVILVWDPPWTPEMLCDQARRDLGWR